MPRRQSSSRGLGGPGVSCRGAALSILASRARSEEDVRRRLLERGYSADEVSGTVSELIDGRELVEASSAEVFVRLRRNRWGRERLEIELRKRFYREETIGAALADLQSEDELGLARRIAGNRGIESSEKGSRRRLFSRLRRMGVSAAVAIRFAGPDAGADE